MTERKPTCYDCIHATINPGHGGSRYEPPEAEHVEECRNEDVDPNIGDDVEWNEEKMPEICGGFTPKLIENCMRKECNKPMGTARYLSKYIEYCKFSGEHVHLCGPGCKDAFAIQRQWDYEEAVKNGDFM